MAERRQGSGMADRREQHPSASIRSGAVDMGNGKVAFGLYAPWKKSVHLVGDFNDWSRGADPMESDGTGFWRIEKRLDPGPCTYQFLLDGEVLICDPYARRLAEGSEDDPPRALIDVGRAPYVWGDREWRRPPFNDLVIYELHVGTFSSKRNFQGVIEKLDYLADLGINCMELLPAYEFRGTTGWGYNPSYFFTVEKSYGDPDDLRHLVDEAHRRGIAVIMDVVLAHTGHNCPFLKMYPYEESPWYGRGIGEENQFGFPMLDYTKPATKDFVKDFQKFWLEDYHIDGFRYDYLHGIGMKGEDGAPFLVNTARAVRKDAYLIGEYSPEAPELVNRLDLSGAWHVGVSYMAKALLGEGVIGGGGWDNFEATFGSLDPASQGYDSPLRMVNYIESHDEGRLVLELVQAGMDRQTARKKSALGASLLLMLAGPVMLYQGQEWGEDTVRTQEYNPLHREFLETQAGKELFDHYSRMIRIRRENQAVRSGNFRIEAVRADEKTGVLHRWNGGGNEIIAVYNFSHGEREVSVPFPRGGTWKDLLSGKGFQIEDKLEMTLGGSDAAIFVKE